MEDGIKTKRSRSNDPPPPTPHTTKRPPKTQVRHGSQAGAETTLTKRTSTVYERRLYISHLFPGMEFKRRRNGTGRRTVVERVHRANGAESKSASLESVPQTVRRSARTGRAEVPVVEAATFDEKSRRGAVSKSSGFVEEQVRARAGRVRSDGRAVVRARAEATSRRSTKNTTARPASESRRRGNSVTYQARGPRAARPLRPTSALPSGNRSFGGGRPRRSARVRADDGNRPCVENARV